MSIKKNVENEEEVHVFEFYDEDHDPSLEFKSTTLAKYNEIDFESDLNEEQLTIINNLRGPMLVIAGAGSGKTRTIVYAVAKLLLSGVKPSEIMLVTFTNKAANEMIKRVETLLGERPKGMWSGTFHALANRFLRIYSKTIGIKPNYVIIDESDSVALMKLSIDLANVSGIEERFPSSKVAKSILSYSINCNKTIRDVILWKYSNFDNPKIISKLKETYKIYKKKKAEAGLLDFDDLLVFWNQLLSEKKVAQLIAKNIKYVLVDEYQDTNYIQDEIIYKIISLNPERNIMVVGDDAQSIYAFRGANYENILNFPKKHADCKIYYITFNYRSVPEILELANDSINHNMRQFKKNMRPTKPSGIKPFHVQVSDDDEQALFIVNQILKLRSEGYNLNDIAILCRAAFYTLKIEMQLRAKNIPFEVRAGVAFFERAHIKDVLAHLRLIENPYDELSWHRIFSMVQGIGTSSAVKIFTALLNVENPIEQLCSKEFYFTHLKGERIPQKGIKNLMNHVANIRHFSSEDRPGELILKIRKFLESYIQAHYENWQDRMDDLKQLAIYAQNYNSVRRFLETLSLNRSTIEAKRWLLGDQSEDEAPLIISTIHRAKGLEWRIVFIPMLCEGFFPSSRVYGDEEEFEEERRVFYVAATRAKEQLYLITPAMIRGFRGYDIPGTSQFISELNPRVYKKATAKFDFKEKEKNVGFKSAVDLL
ncbi:MAG: ATP-dependent helicase [Promethearchaeota archaeon]